MDASDYSQYAERQNLSTDEALLRLFQNAAQFREAEPDRVVDRFDFWRKTLRVGEANLFELGRLGAIDSAQQMQVFFAIDPDLRERIDFEGMEKMLAQLRDADALLFRKWLAEASDREDEAGEQIFAQDGEYALNPYYPLLTGAYWVIDWIGELLHDYSYDLEGLKAQLARAAGRDSSEGELFATIRRAGPDASSALVSFLAKPHIQGSNPVYPPSPSPASLPSSMLQVPPQNWSNPCSYTEFYRVTRAGEKARDVLRGYGAFYATGGRYNRVHQSTLYASPDPVVAITEAAYHQASMWQKKIGGQPNLPKPNGPLKSPHRLWRIEVQAAPPPRNLPVVTIPSNAASLRFPNVIIEREIYNPSQDYENLRTLADLIRAACISPPYSASNPAAIGVEYPSVRTPKVSGYDPSAHAFFIVPVRGSRFRGTVRDMWEMDLEFLDITGNPVSSANTNQIDWETAEFILKPPKKTNQTVPVPPFAANPVTVQGFQQGTVHRVKVNYR